MLYVIEEAVELVYGISKNSNALVRFIPYWLAKSPTEGIHLSQNIIFIITNKNMSAVTPREIVYYAY